MHSWELATQILPAGGHRAYWKADVPERLQLHCDGDGVRRFDASEDNPPGFGFRFLEYVCRDCGKSKKTYALMMGLKRDGGELPRS